MATKKQRERKEVLAEELKDHFNTYETIFVAGVDNVTSNQLHEIRKDLRGDAVIYCGKNTQMRRVIRELEEENPALEAIRSCLKLNVALIFTNKDAAEMCKRVMENKMPSAAKAGMVNQCDVIIPKGMTTLEPTMTNFLQALSISSKITKGFIEILNDEHVLKKGEKCDPGQAALLQKMGITPFEYGLMVENIYQGGNLFSAEVLAISNDDILATFRAGIQNVTAIALTVGQPCQCSVPYSILLAFSNLLAVACATEFSFKEAEDIKKYLGK